ncbi:hypothetical protein BDM02DRAFT_3129359 [Thelephora ganbajun]|uniref:Uncharacterized protein n=1 Tax=Thelephora ganbajun TaxID=370292 RepID=A0ACB6ZEM2_THEGA|nr:hypothetical protein BDM02DRAFT_3129359 [Thelephora ganbajun]
MNGTDLTALASAGEHLFAFKAHTTSVNCLWMYDYLLTLGDEVWYPPIFYKVRMVWKENLEYTPALYLVWVNASMFSYTKSFCQKTKWVVVFHVVIVTVLAQMVIALRVYGVTGRNRLLGGALFVIISAQLCFGIYFVIRAAINPMRSVPEIDLDAFEVCFSKRWRPGEILFNNLMIAFDLLAFVIIFVTAKRRGSARHPGIPSILDTILRDATLYFILIFAGQVLFEMFLFFAPEGVQLMPGVATMVFIPIMVSRLMLSLKKAAIEPTLPWSLATMTLSGHGTGARPGVGTLHFVSRTFDVSHEIPRTLTPPDEEDVELESMS